MSEVWRTSSVHSADIHGAPAPHAENKPQNDNDFHWLPWRLAGQCQRCGHWTAGGA